MIFPQVQERNERLFLGLSKRSYRKLIVVHFTLSEHFPFLGGNSLFKRDVEAQFAKLSVVDDTSSIKIKQIEPIPVDHFQKHIDFVSEE